MYVAKIIQMLEESAKKLTDELKILNPLLNLNGHTMYITHDNHAYIIVFAPLQYKAYVPKIYDGWKVKFTEWDGKNLSELDKYSQKTI